MPQNWDFTNSFRRHPYFIYIILGDHDYVDMGGKLIRSMIADLPNVKLTLIKDAGHVAWIDQPKEFRKLLKKALNLEK